EDAALAAVGTAAVATAAGGTCLFRGVAVAGGLAATPSGAACLAGALTGVPSNPNAGASGRAPRTNAMMVRLNVRRAVCLMGATWVVNCPIHRRPNLLGIFPERT